MKKRPTPILALAMVLLFINTGLAMVDLQLCRTSCEYAARSRADTQPCCREKSAPHAMAMADVGTPLPGDCPHIDTTPDPSASTAFLASSTRFPVPPAGDMCPAAGTDSGIRLPDTEYASAQSGRRSLFPPLRYGPPPYRLYCSLLI